MKHLPIALLLAAACCPIAEAVIYNASWDNGAGTTASGTFDIDTAALLNPGVNPNSGAWLTGMSITIVNALPGNGPGGTYTLSAQNFAGLLLSQAVDMSTELVGQAGFSGGGLFVILANGMWHTHGNSSLSNDAAGWPATDMQLVSFILAGPTGVPDIAAWLSSVNNAQRTYSAGYNMTVVALEGAHHRPLMSYDDMGKERATWVTGDFANSSRRRDVNVSSGEVGTSWKAGANGVFGVAAGYGSQREDLALDGRNDVDGKYMFAEYDHRLASGWIVSVLGMVGSWDAEILRGYLDAGVPDHSYGETGVATRTARLRFDAPTLATVGGFGLSPFVSYSVTQTEVDAYTETGGAFPASYDAQKHQSEEGRLGLVGTRDLTASTRLRLSFEAIHRFDGQGPSLTGQDITGGVAFELDGSDPSPDCVRYGLDIDHKLTPTTMLSISAFGSSTGEVPDVSGAISLRHAF